MKALIFLLVLTSSIRAQEDSIPRRSDFLSPNLPFHNQLSRKAFFTAPQKDSTYAFSDQFIVFESEQLKWGNTILRPNKDYSLNYLRGEVVFNFSLAEPDSIIGTYMVFSFVQPRYTGVGSFILGSQVDDSHRMINKFVNENSTDIAREMTGYGVISRGITVGSNQNTALNSGLNVQISGTISDDVTIEASLSDENTPIQPDGNTESLQEIDKVYIQVKKGNSFRSALGDIEFNYDGTEFSNVSRKLQGLQAELTTSDLSVGASYGNPKGLYQSQRLTIQDGIQGPYELLGKNGERGIIVVSGSEKMWLNGVLLRRGENNDYTINYNAGQITFTPKRQVSSEQRLLVDFQYVSELFSRTSGFSYIKKSWFDGKLRIGASYLKEADDKNTPLNIMVDRSLQDSLKHIDDKSIKQNGIFISGAQKSTRGAYRLTVASMESVFVFVGTDSIGDYNVRFSDVGIGRGDYAQGNTIGEFIFVGKGNGSFLPIVSLKLPSQEQLGDFVLEIRPFSFLKLKSEVALSDFDNNTYSQKSFAGKAYSLQMDIAKAKIKGLGEIDVQAKWRHKDSLFQEADRVNLPDNDRSWNIPPNAVGEELQREYAIYYRPLDKLTVSNFFGDLERSGSLSSKKLGGGVLWSDSGSSLASFNAAKISTNLISSSTKSQAIRREGNASYTLFNVTPGIEFETEHISNVQRDSGFGSAFQRVKPRLDFSRGAAFQSGVSYDRRLDRLTNDQDSLKGNLSITSNYQSYMRARIGSDFSSSIEFSHYEKTFYSKFSDANHLDKISNLAAIAFDAGVADRAIQISMDYQLSDERVQNRKIIFIPVLSNTGNFIRVEADSFRQVPQGQGDWIQSSVRSPGFSPIVGVHFSTRWGINYGKLLVNDEDSSGLSNFLRGFTTETLCRIEENQTDPSRSFYFLNILDYMKRNTLRGSIYLKNDALYHYQSGFWRWRYELQKSKIQLYQDGGEFQKRTTHNWWNRHNLTDEVAIESEFGMEKSLRLTTVRIGGLGSNYSIRSWSTIPSVIYRPIPQWELIQKVSFRKLRDNFSKRNATVFGVVPQAGYSWLEKGRAVFSMELTKLSLDRPATGAPFELTQGLTSGWNSLWSITCGYKINDHMTADLYYTGRRLSGQKTVHIGNAEVKAYF